MTIKQHLPTTGNIGLEFKDRCQSRTLKSTFGMTKLQSRDTERRKETNKRA